SDRRKPATSLGGGSEAAAPPAEPRHEVVEPLDGVRRGVVLDPATPKFEQLGRGFGERLGGSHEQRLDQDLVDLVAHRSLLVSLTLGERRAASRGTSRIRRPCDGFVDQPTRRRVRLSKSSSVSGCRESYGSTASTARHSSRITVSTADRLPAMA